MRELFAYLQLLLFMALKFIWMIFSSSWMFVIIQVNLCMTFKTKCNGIIYLITSSFSLLYNMISFNLDSTETMTYTASSMAFDVLMIESIK
jgi:hypothetical protein